MPRARPIKRALSEGKDRGTRSSGRASGFGLEREKIRKKPVTFTSILISSLNFPRISQGKVPLNN